MKMDIVACINHKALQSEKKHLIRLRLGRCNAAAQQKRAADVVEILPIQAAGVTNID
jgi:hypothetical protein